jgi:hypothetical protein
MTEVVVKIMVELISTLALATKQVKQGRPSEYLPVDASLNQPDTTQRNRLRSFWERTRWRLYYSGWTDSHRMRLGRLHHRRLRSSMDLSMI